MRNLISIVENATLGRGWGCFIDPHGKIYTINKINGHADFAEQFSSGKYENPTEELLDNGWIRMVFETNAINITIVNQLTYSRMMLSSLITVIENSNSDYLYCDAIKFVKNNEGKIISDPFPVWTYDTHVFSKKNIREFIRKLS